MKLTLSLLQFLAGPGLLAQLAGPEMTATLGIIAIIVAIVSGVYQISLNRRHLTEKEPARRVLPDPLRTASVHDFVTEPQFEKFCDIIDRKFETVHDRISQEGRRIDERVNDVLKEVSNLRGAFNQSQHRHHPND